MIDSVPLLGKGTAGQASTRNRSAWCWRISREHLVDARVDRPLRAERVETAFQNGLLGRGWLGALRLQSALEFPELLPHARDRRTVRLVRRDQADQGPFGRHPARRLRQEVELLSTVTFDHQV